jgi:hypothetical protein
MAQHPATLARIQGSRGQVHKLGLQARFKALRVESVTLVPTPIELPLMYM